MGRLSGVEAPSCASASYVNSLLLPIYLGTGCHSNDLETVSVYFSLNSGHLAEIFVVQADAHGSPLLANVLEVRDDVGRDKRLKDGRTFAEALSLPVTMLVEANKHAASPDLQGDGAYQPGVDVNVRTKDAWGVRDTFWQRGGSGSFRYRPSMTAERTPENRVGPSLDGSITCINACGGAYGLPKETYDLRELPEDCLDSKSGHEPSPEPGCKVRSLNSLFVEKGLVESRSSWFVKTTEFFGDFFAVGVEGSSIGLGFRGSSGFDSRGGVHGLEFMAYFNERGRLFRDVQYFFTPSLTRAVDWYVSGGLRSWRGDSGNDGLTLKLLNIFGKHGRTYEPIVEGGLVFRWISRIEVRTGIGTSLNKPWRVSVVATKHLSILSLLELMEVLAD